MSENQYNPFQQWKLLSMDELKELNNAGAKIEIASRTQKPQDVESALLSLDSSTFNAIFSLTLAKDADALETGKCPYCDKILTGLLSDYEDDDKGQDYLIDMKKVYEGKLEANGSKVSGHKVLKKGTYEFQGLLSCDKVALWYAAEDSLQLVKEDK